MKIIDLEEVSDYRVKNWIEEKIPNLTQYQKEQIRCNEIIRYAPFYFMERRKKQNNDEINSSIHSSCFYNANYRTSI
jgi:hypothetical protein